MNWCKSVLLIAFASAQFLLAQSEQIALCTFFFLVPKAYEAPALEKLVYRRKLVYRHSFNILLFQSVAARQ